MERGPEQGLGRLVLKALAITSALTFVAIVMVNACATHAAPTNAPPYYSAPTKAGPVVPPNESHAAPAQAPAQVPATEPASPAAEPVYAPATKSMTVIRPRPLMQAPAQPAPQQAPTPQQPGAR